MPEILKKWWHPLPAMLNIACTSILTLGAKDAIENEVTWQNGLMMGLGFLGSAISLKFRSTLLKNNYPHSSIQTKSDVVGRIGLQIAAGMIIATHANDITESTAYFNHAVIAAALTFTAIFSLINDAENYYYVQKDQYLSILPWSTEEFFDNFTPRQRYYTIAGWLTDRAMDFMLVFTWSTTLRDYFDDDRINVLISIVITPWIFRKLLLPQKLCFKKLGYDAVSRWGEYGEQPEWMPGLIIVPTRRVMLAWPMFIAAKVTDDCIQSNFNGNTAIIDSAQLINAIAFILLFEKCSLLRTIQYCLGGAADEEEEPRSRLISRQRVLSSRQQLLVEEGKEREAALEPSNSFVLRQSPRVLSRDNSHLQRGGAFPVAGYGAVDQDAGFDAVVKSASQLSKSGSRSPRLLQPALAPVRDSIARSPSQPPLEGESPSYVA